MAANPYSASSARPETVTCPASSSSSTLFPSASSSPAPGSAQVRVIPGVARTTDWASGMVSETARTAGVVGWSAHAARMKEAARVRFRMGSVRMGREKCTAGSIRTAIG